MKVTTVIFIVSLLIINKAHSMEESYVDVENNNNYENEQNESAEEEEDAPLPQSEETNDDVKPVNEVKTPDDVTSSHPLKENEENSLVSNFNRYASLPGENSFSFHHFNGPISKEIRQVVVPNSNPLQPGAHSVDFVGKPDYSFAYGVHDDQLKNSHTHMESRDGDALRGEYRVLQPDGLVRIVRYYTDPLRGFQMKVEYAKI